MDEAEAEAVLRALGPSLEWDTYSDGARAKTRYGSYQIVSKGLEKRIGRRTRYYVARLYVHKNPGVWWDREEIEGPYRYEHKVNAKAACEHHYATGEWTPR